ncbi:potassium-transporting ATPase subunit KdpC [Variovorax dokdonensis]|uniref:Potassium-transporting ATPase KdpC subunit n=1 Tax=Variovorax dokdonensis TaxID=344883 RepID=A0ABT7NDW9_9BURK|nr:potassium-transporting ATPase subunit KdpC [Variovorax dokdonensis]MDM0046142.1 potassium-transporting ATPase subunit KdpC [Variovorax dokdonensis]
MATNERSVALTAPREPAQASITGSAPWRGAIGLAVLALGGFGFLYSLAGVGLGQALFPASAQGNLIEQGGKVVGSEWVAQPFADARYFSPRPSAVDWQPMSAGGSNQARTNPQMRERVEAARAEVAKRENVDPAQVPSDLVTQSGGGFDPHISLEAARIQVPRVAQARGLDPAVVQRLIDGTAEGAQFGILGQPRVNVLALNLALDRSAGAR